MCALGAAVQAKLIQNGLLANSGATTARSSAELFVGALDKAEQAARSFQAASLALGDHVVVDAAGAVLPLSFEVGESFLPDSRKAPTF